MENANPIVVFVSATCPKCKMLMRQMDTKNIAYQTTDDVEPLIEMGIRELPVLKVGESYMTFTDAWKWIKEK